MIANANGRKHPGHAKTRSNGRPTIATAHVHRFASNQVCCDHSDGSCQLFERKPLTGISPNQFKLAAA